ncbi:MAG TPA: hypothetical protein DDX71_01470 [Ruminococcus sp.]|nr:hypothetical protein [Ruminococcus sp.]
MMRQLKKILLGGAAAVSLCASMLMPVSVSAKRQFENLIPSCKVYDIQGVLDNEQEQEINQYIQDTSEKLDMYVAVHIVGPETSFNSDSAVEAYADDQYDYLFNPEQKVDTDGVLLVLNNSTNYDYLTTSGIAQLYYYNAEEDNRVWWILDDITPMLKNGNYEDAIYVFCDELLDYYQRGIPENAYTYNPHTKKYAFYYKGQLKEADKLPWWFGKPLKMLGAGSAFIGAIVALIILVILRCKYSLTEGLDASNYIHSPSTNFYVREDHFLREHTSRTHINSDSGRSGGGHSSHGGGGHSHSSSGGHSHGGGGHHR